MLDTFGVIAGECLPKGWCQSNSNQRRQSPNAGWASGIHAGPDGNVDASRRLLWLCRYHTACLRCWVIVEPGTRPYNSPRLSILVYVTRCQCLCPCLLVCSHILAGPVYGELHCQKASCLSCMQNMRTACICNIWGTTLAAFLSYRSLSVSQACTSSKCIELTWCSDCKVCTGCWRDTSAKACVFITPLDIKGSKRCLGVQSNAQAVCEYAEQKTAGSAGPSSVEILVQGTVTWGNAPSLKALPSGAAVNVIHRNPVDYMTAPRPAVAGHISVAAGTANVLKTIDVTDAVGCNCTSSPLPTLISSLTGLLKSLASRSLGAILAGLLCFGALLCEKSCQCLQARNAMPEARNSSKSSLCSGSPIAKSRS